MAIQNLTDEQTRTWTREQKDRWWLDNVFRGDMAQLTIRSGLTGFILGGVLAATALYIVATCGAPLLSGFRAIVWFGVMGSMMLALRKRPVATDEVEGAIDRVIERLRSLGEREVPTNRVGDFVMRELAKLDKIAYIRFASVYRSFESPDDFREVVQEVKAAKRKRK